MDSGLAHPAPLDALADLQTAHVHRRRCTKGGRADRQRRGNTVSNRDMPDICLQYMVAVMLLDKTATFGSAHDKARMKDPAVMRQRAKVEVVADPRIDARRPKREAIVEVTLADGTQMSEWVRDVRGTAIIPCPATKSLRKRVTS